MCSLAFRRRSLRPRPVSPVLSEASLAPQTGKLQKVLGDLRVSGLPILEATKARLVEVVKQTLDVFLRPPPTSAEHPLWYTQ